MSDDRKMTVEKTLEWCKSQPHKYPKSESGPRTAAVILTVTLSAAAILWLSKLKQ